MLELTKAKRRYYACYSTKGEDYILEKRIADVIVFNCRVTRDNWVEMMNKKAFHRGDLKVAINVTSNFARNVINFVKGDNIDLKPIHPDSKFYISDLSNRQYFEANIIYS